MFDLDVCFADEYCPMFKFEETVDPQNFTDINPQHAITSQQSALATLEPSLMLKVARLFRSFSLAKTIQRPVLLRFEHSAVNVEKSSLPSRNTDPDLQSLTTTNTPEALLQPTPLLYFYQGGPDHHGRHFEDILKLSDYELENGIDYIDWLFPVPEASQSSKSSPRLDELTRQTIRKDAILILRMRLALRRILRFYGFKGHYRNWICTQNTTSSDQLTLVTRPLSRKLFVVRRAKHFKRAAYSWFNSNPNDKRMMRIIRSLRCMGLDAEAEGFYQALTSVFESQEGYPKPIHSSSHRRWEKAARRPLRLAPHWRLETVQRMLAQNPGSIKKLVHLSTEGISTGPSENPDFPEPAL